MSLFSSNYFGSNYWSPGYFGLKTVLKAVYDLTGLEIEVAGGNPLNPDEPLITIHKRATWNATNESEELAILNLITQFLEQEGRDPRFQKKPSPTPRTLTEEQEVMEIISKFLHENADIEDNRNGAPRESATLV